MRLLTPTVLIVIYVACAAKVPPRAGPAASKTATERACAPLGTAYLRTTLYFGLTRPGGTVSEGQWQAFLREEVTPRFPDGLTVWEADGQWRRPDGSISRERAKILLVVHDETPAVRAALATVVTRYKRSFEQESVLWETAQVCAAF
jgi:hypothetical protein